MQTTKGAKIALSLAGKRRRQRWLSDITFEAEKLTPNPEMGKAAKRLAAVPVAEWEDNNSDWVALKKWETTI